MPAVLCPRCNRKCRSESALQAHLDPKHPCDQGKYACTRCLELFQAKWRRDEHQKGCTGGDSVTSVAAECMELRAVVPTAAALSAKAALRSLGDESVAHIGAAQLEQIGQSSELGRGSSLVHFFTLLHCSPDAPQNHNMLLHGNGSKLAVFSGGRWRPGATRDWIWQALFAATMLFRDLLQDADYKRDLLMRTLDPLLMSRDRRASCLHQHCAGPRCERGTGCSAQRHRPQTGCSVRAQAAARAHASSGAGAGCSVAQTHTRSVCCQHLNATSRFQGRSGSFVT